MQFQAAEIQSISHSSLLHPQCHQALLHQHKHLQVCMPGIATEMRTILYKQHHFGHDRTCARQVSQ